MDATRWTRDDADLARHGAGRESRRAARERRAIQNDGRAALHSPHERVHADHHGVSGKRKEHGRGDRGFPGGAYQILSMDLEGTEVCDWLNEIGVNCVLLKYRVPNSGPYPRSPQALEDAQRAVGVVRLHATEWGIDPNRVGVIGFSAGAHLAVAVSNHYDKRIYPAQDAADQLSCRPDFALVLYPGYLALPVQSLLPIPIFSLRRIRRPRFFCRPRTTTRHTSKVPSSILCN